MYQPPAEILEKYANVLINYALNDCKGVRAGETVLIQVPECAKPMLAALRRAVLKAGANPLVQYLPDDMAREFYELANEQQLDYFPAKFLRGRVDEVDHSVAIIAETNKHELDGIPPERIMRRQKAFKPYMEWRDEKENAGRFTWTLGLYGTEAMAQEVDLSLEEYWQEIIKACYLDVDDPVAKWRELEAEIERIKEALNAMKIEKVHVEAPGTDLWVKLGADRTWLGGSGRNIPSFEIFISPDWRGTNGHIQFTEPLYAYGQLITNVRLAFEEGLVVDSSAEKGEEMLKEMLKTENADKAGEYSLTDARFSRITKFMGETLYDENVGGEHGNTHLAVGKSYKESYVGDPSSVSDEEWQAMGFNDSVVHTDIVATSPRTVTATLPDGSEQVIYKDGRFQV